MFVLRGWLVVQSPSPGPGAYGWLFGLRARARVRVACASPGVCPVFLVSSLVCVACCVVSFSLSPFFSLFFAAALGLPVGSQGALHSLSNGTNEIAAADGHSNEQQQRLIVQCFPFMGFPSFGVWCIFSCFISS